MKRAVRHLLSAVLLTSASIGTSTTAVADIITREFSFDNFMNGNGSRLSSSFLRFDSTLGTLNSVSASITGTLLVGSFNSYLLIDVFAKTPSGNLTTNFPKNSFSLSNDTPDVIINNIRLGGTSINRSDLLAFTGAGPAQFGLSFTSQTGGFFFLADPNFTIAYDYTPAGTMPGAVPEPATWAMMLLGFAGLAFAAGRRRDHRYLEAR